MGTVENAEELRPSINSNPPVTKSNSKRPQEKSSRIAKNGGT